jgi:transposase
LIDFYFSAILNKAKEMNLTDYDHVAFDGSIFKANNSPFNSLVVKK